MRYFTSACLGFLVCLIAFSGGALAKEFRGKITQINPLAGIIMVQLEGQSKKPNQEMLVNLKKKMKLEGIKSVEELVEGDEILFDASESMFGSWSFNTIKKILPKKAKPFGGAS